MTRTGDARTPFLGRKPSVRPSEGDGRDPRDGRDAVASVADHAEALVGYAQRFRIMGSLALSMCQLAAGRVDAVCSSRGAIGRHGRRAAPVREVGLSIGFADAGPWDGAPLDTRPTASSSPPPRMS